MTLLLLFEDCAAKNKKDLRSHLRITPLSPTPNPFAPDERVSDPARRLVKALFQSEFTIELLNRPITLASGTLKSLPVQNPDCTARVLDHPFGL